MTKIDVKEDTTRLSYALPALRDILHDRLSTSKNVCEAHGVIETWNPSRPPDAVAFVQTTDEVSQIMRICNEHRVPVIGFGVGTSLEGNVSAVRGGLCVDFSKMDKVLKVNQDDMDCKVQAGVTRIALNNYLRDTGLFFPVDPGADATIGGMVATRASGTNAVRYGTMRNNVLNVTAVLANGKVIQTAKRALKSSAGYDLTALMIGSEGTLALITEIQLRLFVIPEFTTAGVCAFDSLEKACRTVIEVMQSGVPISKMELLDAAQIEAFNNYSNYNMPVKPTLFFEFNGMESNEVNRQFELFSELAKENGGIGMQRATKTEERNRLWKARHEVFWACKANWPKKDALVTDVCVPITNLADCIMATHRDIEQAELNAPIVGHVGDGNFHVIIMFDKNNHHEMKKVKDFCQKLVKRALKAEGTCTGEHGIGLGKRDYLIEELGGAVDVMAAVKMALDPKNILNPDKIFKPEAFA